MANRYVASVLGGNSGGALVDLTALTAGVCGLTLRRLEVSFSPTTLSSSNVAAVLGLGRGTSSGGSAITVNPVQQSNPVSALATASYNGTVGSAISLLNWMIPDTAAYLVEFDGPDGITVTSGDALILSFIAPGTNSVAANLWFEE